ncbi:MAG: hypothetical protein ACJ79L_15765 [Anaeromyxobacteraceae bacterium]
MIGVAGIVALGAAGTALVLLADQQADGAPQLAGATPAEPAPAPGPVAPPEPPAPPMQWPEGLISIQLPPITVARDLTAALARCHRVNAMTSGSPAVLTLELEARDPVNLVVLDAEVASPGAASEGLIACAREILRGRRVEVGDVPLGRHFVARYEVTPPLPPVAPPVRDALAPAQADARPGRVDPPPVMPAEPPAATRQQVLRRRGGGSR